MPLFWLNEAWLPAVSVSIGMISVPLAKFLFPAVPLLTEKTESTAQRASPTSTKRSGLVRPRATLLKPQMEVMGRSLVGPSDARLCGEPASRSTEVHDGRRV